MPSIPAPLVYGYKRARLRGKTKGQAVGSAAGAGLMLGGATYAAGKAGMVPGMAMAYHYGKQMRKYGEFTEAGRIYKARTIVRAAPAIALGGPAAKLGAVGAALLYGVHKWKKTKPGEARR